MGKMVKKLVMNESDGSKWGNVMLNPQNRSDSDLEWVVH